MYSHTSPPRVSNGGNGAGCVSSVKLAKSEGSSRLRYTRVLLTSSEPINLQAVLRIGLIELFK